MATDHIVALLIQERDRLNRAIEALHGPIKRRGRPPKRASFPSSISVEAEAPPVKKKRTFTAAQRKEQAKRMKAYWVAKKKAK